MLRSLLQQRVILVTGKGGVGKTSVAAALARFAAARGKRVLLTEIGLSDDVSSPLARLFGRATLPLQAEPLQPGLAGVLLSAQVGHQIFFQSVLRSRRLTRAALSSKGIRKLLESAPSGRELGVFVHFCSLISETDASGETTHDFIVVDMPATGHALALTSLPSTMLQLFQRGPVARVVETYRQVVHNADLTRAYVVTLAEELPASETIDLIAGLERSDITVGGVFINRAPPVAMLPQELALLGELVSGREVLGRESVAELASAQEAIRRLDQALAVPMLTIPTLRDDPLIDAIVQVLSTGIRGAEATRAPTHEDVARGYIR